MTFRFDFDKSVQAAGVLLGLDGDRMGRIRLLKLMYIAERELLAEAGRPLTGDRAVAMKHGPVPSRVYDLIKGESAKAGEWGRFIHSEGHAVVLRADPGRGDLSRREVEKLTEVTDRFRNMDDWTLSEATHEFEEWSRNHVKGASSPIPWRDALEAQGKPGLVEIIERDEEDRRVLDALFEG